MPTLDLVIQENHGQFNFTSPVLPPERFDLADDIYVGKIDSEAVKLLLGFGYPTGYNVVTDWLIEEEMMEVRALFHHMAAVTLPFRLSRAFWYHEYAARTYYGEVRWVLVCTALESLLNTDPYHSGAQFRGRVPLVASSVHVTMTEDEARTAWSMRSHLSHRGATGKLNPSEEEIYRKLEMVLRGALKKAILDGGFASIFADDSRIRLSWPIMVGGKSI